MADPTYPLFTVFAFLGFVFALIPLPWHFQAWNAGTCIYMLWASLACLVHSVNSVIWNGNMDIVASVWCDIATKFLLGAGVGIPASSLCINRRLYNIASVRVVSVTRQDKRREVITDICIAIGIPVLVMVLHYVVQGHRFDILEDVGCLATTYWTFAAVPLVFMWPTLIGSISFVYAALTLRAFWRRRVQFSELLSISSSLTMSRYFRLMLFSCLEMSGTIPVSVYSTYIITKGVPISPWISWADTHYNFSFVEQIPADVWRSYAPRRINAEMTRWLFPCSALLFFALFGFAQEARKQYMKAFRRMKAEAGYLLPIRGGSIRSWKNGFYSDSQARSYASETTLPTAVYSPRRFKRSDSLFSSVVSFTDIDVEKGLSSTPSSLTALSSPSETVVSCSEPGSPTSTSHLNPSSPPSLSPPPIAYYPSPSPPYRRPFSSSTILPLTSNSPTILEPPNTLPILIHRESCQTF